MRLRVQSFQTNSIGLEASTTTPQSTTHDSISAHADQTRATTYHSGHSSSPNPDRLLQFKNNHRARKLTHALIHAHTRNTRTCPVPLHNELRKRLCTHAITRTQTKSTPSTLAKHESHTHQQTCTPNKSTPLHALVQNTTHLHPCTQEWARRVSAGNTSDQTSTVHRCRIRPCTLSGSWRCRRSCQITEWELH